MMDARGSHYPPRAEATAELLSEAARIRATLRAEYGEQIEQMLAAKGFYTYDTKQAGSPPSSPARRPADPVGAAKAAVSVADAREAKVKALISEGTPLRESLRKAQAHALASLLDSTKAGIAHALRGEGGDSGDQQAHASPPTSPLGANAAEVRRLLEERLQLLEKMNAEHDRQERCLSGAKRAGVDLSRGEAVEAVVDDERIRAALSPPS